MRDPGSLGDLSPGVVNRGPGATCRVGWSRRGRKLPDAVAAKAIEAQPSFGQIKPGEDAWDAAPRTGPETIWDTRHRSGLTHLRRATNRLDAKAAVGAFAATRPPAVCASATSPGAARQSFQVSGIPRPSAPAARLLFATPWSRRARHHAAVSQPQTTILRHLRPEWAFSSARLVRQGSSPKGRNGEAGSSAADEPGPQGDAQFLLTQRLCFNLLLPEEKLLRTREEPRTVR